MSSTLEAMVTGIFQASVDAGRHPGFADEKTAAIILERTAKLAQDELGLPEFLPADQMLSKTAALRIEATLLQASENIKTAGAQPPSADRLWKTASAEDHQKHANDVSLFWMDRHIKAADAGSVTPVTPNSVANAAQVDPLGGQVTPPRDAGVGKTTLPEPATVGRELQSPDLPSVTPPTPSNTATDFTQKAAEGPGWARRGFDAARSAGNDVAGRVMQTVQENPRAALGLGVGTGVAATGAGAYGLYRHFRNAGIPHEDAAELAAMHAPEAGAVDDAANEIGAEHLASVMAALPEQKRASLQKVASFGAAGELSACRWLAFQKVAFNPAGSLGDELPFGGSGGVHPSAAMDLVGRDYATHPSVRRFARAGKWVSEHKLPVAAGTAAGVGTLAGIGALIHHYRSKGVPPEQATDMAMAHMGGDEMDPMTEAMGAEHIAMVLDSYSPEVKTAMVKAAQIDDNANKAVRRVVAHKFATDAGVPEGAKKTVGEKMRALAGKAMEHKGKIGIGLGATAAVGTAAAVGKHMYDKKKRQGATEPQATEAAKEAEYKAMVEIAAFGKISAETAEEAGAPPPEQPAEAGAPSDEDKDDQQLVILQEILAKLEELCPGSPDAATATAGLAAHPEGAAHLAHVVNTAKTAEEADVMLRGILAQNPILAKTATAQDLSIIQQRFAKRAGLKNFWNKIRGGSVTPVTPNTNASSPDPLAKIDNANRPAGHAQPSGPGQTTLTTPPGDMTVRTPARPGVAHIGTNNTVSNETKGAEDQEYVAAISKVAAEFAPYVPLHLTTDQKLAVYQDLLATPPSGRPARLNAIINGR